MCPLNEPLSLSENQDLLKTTENNKSWYRRSVIIKKKQIGTEENGKIRLNNNILDWLLLAKKMKTK